jgi:hypothetical protein
MSPALFTEAVIAQQIPMVCRQQDIRVIQTAGLFEGRQNPPDLFVQVDNVRKIVLAGS